MKNLQIDLTKSQADFIALPHKNKLIVGGVGSGKTRVMAVAALLDATHSTDGVITIYEPTYRHIRDIAIPELKKVLNSQGIEFTENEQKHRIILNTDQISDFEFRSYEEPDTLIGYESYASHIDEIDTIPLAKAQKVWRNVKARTRQWPSTLHEQHMKWSESHQRLEPVHRMYAYSTPEGFNFTYQKWGLKPKEKKKFDEWTKLYGCIHAKTADNSFLDEDYYNDLLHDYEGTPFAKAYLDGEWVNLVSGTVYSNYNPELHNSFEIIQPGEPLYIGQDFNVNNNSSTIWVKRNGGQHWHAVMELTGVKDTPETIRIIRERWQSKGHKIYVYPDASNPRSANNASTSSLALLDAAGFIIRARPKNPFVTDRVECTQKAFSDGRLFVNQRLAPTVHDCLMKQAYDKNMEPDKNSGYDHMNDATTYPIAYEMQIRRKLYSVKVGWAC